jgi:hypothetical protein
LCVVVVVVGFPAGGNPKTTTHRLEQNWHYTYVVGFRSLGFSLILVFKRRKHVASCNILTNFLIFINPNPVTINSFNI